MMPSDETQTGLEAIVRALIDSVPVDADHWSMARCQVEMIDDRSSAKSKCTYRTDLDSGLVGFVPSSELGPAVMSLMQTRAKQKDEWTVMKLDVYNEAADKIRFETHFSFERPQSTNTEHTKE